MLSLQEANVLDWQIMRHWSFNIFLAFLLCSFSVLAERDIPDFGLTDTESFSMEQEKAIGSQVILEMKKAHALLEDPAATDYLQRLGNTLLGEKNLEKNGPIHFFWVDNTSVNAFALPGRFIGVHTGLLRFTHTESELAAVLAHEIAHVQQRHIAQLYTRMSREQWKQIVGALAAAAFAIGKNSNAAIGALSAGNAAMIESALTFTREHETEADRLGMEFLVQAGISPNAMSHFFKRLEAQQRFQSEMPVFLRSHPLTTERLTASTRLAARYPDFPITDPLPFHLIRARLELPNFKLQPATQKILQKQLEKEHGAPKIATQYSLAHFHALMGQMPQALSHMHALWNAYPQEPLFLLDLAEFYGQTKDLKKSIALLESASFQKPYPLIQISLADSLIQDKQASRALDLLRTLEAKEGSSATLYYLRAKAYAALKKPEESALAQAEYFWLEGMVPNCFWSLEKVLKAAPPNSRPHQRAQARLKELKALLSTETVDNSVDR